MYNISKVADEQANVGEGPLWDDEAQVLYWADIRSGRLFKFNPSTGENKTIYSGIYVGGFSKNSFGGLTLGTWNGVLLWESDRKKGGYIKELLKEKNYSLTTALQLQTDLS